MGEGSKSRPLFYARRAGDLSDERVLHAPTQPRPNYRHGRGSCFVLQGLITNDIHAATPKSLLYACMLTPQGKFLHDFFVHAQNDSFRIDCEGGARAEDLLRRLTMFKLRADIALSLTPTIQVYGVFGSHAYGLPDPRHGDMGHRSFEKPADIAERALDHPDGWDARRIALTIPDGSRDMTIEKSTLDEGHLDQLNAVSYDKGCYVGQELTARMHYRGLGKKHLKTIKISDHPDADIRSSCGDYAIALMRD